MLAAMIVSPDEALSAELERALVESRLAGAVRVCADPGEPEWRMLRSTEEAVAIFLTLESAEEFLAAADRIEENLPGVPMVGVSRHLDQQALLAMLRAGVRETLSPPFDPHAVREALLRVGKLRERRAPGTETPSSVLAFLPSKPGVGASTVALHLSLAMARAGSTRVLLADFDLQGGIIGFLLGLASRHSVIDAVERAEELDPRLWSGLVSQAHGIDVLPAASPSAGMRIDPSYLAALLSFARHNYDVVTMDLSGMLEEHTVRLLGEATRIFLVCTPEVPSLHLAGRKLKYLHAVGLGGRIRIVLNRWSAHAVVSQREIEHIVGAAVEFTLPNDYATLHRALRASQPVEPGSRLGQRFEEVARSLLELPAAAPPRKRGLLDYLSLGQSAPEAVSGAE